MRGQVKSTISSALLAVLALACAAAGGAERVHAQDRRAPPNIVLFIADDLGMEDTEPYGNTVVRTPNLERLAGESLRFTRVFAASPTCSPSRSTMYTGLMPFRNGAHANHTGVKEGTQSIVHYLRPIGYRVALAGKLHVGPREAFPFELVPNSNGREPGYEKRPGLFHDLNMPAVDAWLAGLPKDQPFLLIVADHSPHVVWPERPEYDPAAVDVPPTHIDTPELRHARARYYTDVTKMDRNLGLLLESLERRGYAENTLVAFTADQGPQWPFGKWSLYDAGVRAPLLVRWPGRVRPGTSTDALVSLADLVPTFVEAAGGEAPDGIDGRSFVPVLLGKADAHREVVFASHTGDAAMNRSPARMLRTAQFKYILNLAPDTLYTTHMDRVKSEGYWNSWRERSRRDEHAAAVLRRYHHRPAEELYDVVADPYERRNLAADPRHAGLLEDFRQRMARWRAEQGDTETGPEQLPKERRRGKPVAPYVF